MRMTDLVIYPYWWGTFSRSTKREISDPDPQHPTKQEITRLIMFQCVTASRTDKLEDDEEVNEGEDKGRTEMQKFTMFFPFPLSWRPNGK
jgi:hypothetical protein